MSYIDVDEYVSTPRTTDPTELLCEERIRSHELRRLLAERDAELADRDQLLNELLAELAGIA